MYLDTQLKMLCTKFFEDLKKTENEKNQIYYTVLYFIHSAPHLSILYLNWTNLEVHEKLILNNQMKTSLPTTSKLVYPPVIRAFEYWDMVQDTYGAPGFHSNPLKNELSEETDRNIVKMLLIMEKIVKQIYTKRKFIEEFSSYKEPKSILYSYKWRMICKSINKKRSYLTFTKDECHKSGDRSEEDSYTSDLNGCGDTTWFSDIE